MRVSDARGSPCVLKHGMLVKSLVSSSCCCRFAAHEVLLLHAMPIGEVNLSRKFCQLDVSVYRFRNSEDGFIAINELYLSTKLLKH